METLTVVPFPPVKCTFVDEKVEEKAENEPKRVLSFLILVHFLSRKVQFNSLVLAGGMLPAALKNIGTLMYRTQLLGYRR